MLRRAPHTAEDLNSAIQQIESRKTNKSSGDFSNRLAALGFQNTRERERIILSECIKREYKDIQELDVKQCVALCD